jgi:hypothetical protein
MLRMSKWRLAGLFTTIASDRIQNRQFHSDLVFHQVVWSKHQIDRVFSPEVIANQKVYEIAVKDLTLSALKGINCNFLFLYLLMGLQPPFLLMARLQRVRLLP